jgi:hypothetical protein
MCGQVCFKTLSVACMRFLSICGVYTFKNSIYVSWYALFMPIYVICDIYPIVTHLDYHLITLSFRHPTNCMIYVLKLPHAHILVCNDLFVLSHGCIHLGGVSCINHGIKLILLIIVENSNWLSSITKKGEIKSASRSLVGFG